MTERYFVADRLAPPAARLCGPEAHHLIHVMRARVGDQVVLFDGSGWEFPSRIEAIGRRQVDLAVVDRLEIDRELPIPLTLAVSLPKGDRQRWLVEKAVELGVGRLVPLATRRSVAQPGTKALGRLRRAVIEASKQCGRNRLMEIAEPVDWPDLFPAHRHTPIRWLAHRCEAAGPPRMETSGTEAAHALPQAVVAAVGPEGGWTPEEIAQAVRAGWQIVGLGPRTLRIETAALHLAAVVAHGCTPG